MQLRANGLVGTVGLGCLLVSIIVVLRITRETGMPVAESKLTRNSTSEAPADLPEASLSLTSSLPSHPKKPASPQGQSVDPTQLLIAEALSGLDEAPGDSIVDPAVKEGLGRQALNFVGADPAADAIWVWLINDPELSPKVRQDLIEDLNENGFSDGNGRRPTVDDLPLIESRLLLIEEQAPFAMDEVNAAAFAEAYKDLANMWWRLTQ
jgi:hypothetical protein